MSSTGSESPRTQTQLLRESSDHAKNGNHGLRRIQKAAKRRARTTPSSGGLPDRLSGSAPFLLMSDIMYGDTCLGWPGARGPFQTPVTRQQCLSAAWRRTAGGSTLGWTEGKSHSSDLRGDECQVLGGVPSRRGGCCCFFFWERCGS